MLEKSIKSLVGAAMAGGTMLFAASVANATVVNGFSEMSYRCTYTGPISVTMPCGPTVKPDSVNIELDGHIGIWETYHALGAASATIHFNGIYTGETEILGDKIYYRLGVDKDVFNWTSSTFWGFDLAFPGPTNWEPILLSNPPAVDTAGYFFVNTWNSGGVSFNGTLAHGETAKWWFGVDVPLHYVGTFNSTTGLWTGDVHGHLEIRQFPIPEPAAIAIFAFGLAGLGFAARRRKVA